MQTPSRPSFASVLVLSLGVLQAVTACRPTPKVVPGPAPVPAPVPVAAPVVVAAPAEEPVPATFACAVDGASVPDDVKRICVPLRGEFRGSPKALVNIVMFSDFECPFCSRVLPTLERLLGESDALRVYFHHLPLKFHAHARAAALASVAAGARGQFWPMHDKLFANQGALDDTSLVRYAGELGIDEATFQADLAAPATKAVVDADLALSRTMEVRGTPNFFINGRRVAGAQPYEAFKKIVDDELARAEKLLAGGTPRGQVYAALMAGKGKGLGTPGGTEAAAEVPRPTLSSEVFKVVVGSSPVRGAAQPKVTLIAFSDFECPYCARANGTLDKLLKLYPEDLQVVFKHLPLPFHSHAKDAALAALAAGEQGKFWPMHDRLFAERTALTAADLERHAAEIGLDMKRFKREMGTPKLQAMLDADLAQARRFGVRGTPSFFINGHAFAGAYPLDSFKALVEEARTKADQRLAAGAPRAGLYEALIKDGLAKRAPAKPAARPGEPKEDVAYRIPLEGAPVRGAKHALVTIVEYSDFQCPFCKRVQGTLDRILEDYPGQVRIAWRNLPMPFHAQAKPAALAALAAGKQGKFWEMHRKLFGNSKDLSDEALTAHARALKLNMKRWQKDREGKALLDVIQADSDAAAKMGVRGTPMFFVNGKIVRGAQPFEAFKTVIDAELAAAKAMVRKGIPAAKVYETIMKTAKASND